MTLWGVGLSAYAGISDVDWTGGASIEAGEQFLWYTGKGAVRLGNYPNYYLLSESSVGASSVGLGEDNYASMVGGIAAGVGNDVVGYSSSTSGGVALGKTNSVSLSDAGAAIGKSNTAGGYSGYSTCIAIGEGNTSYAWTGVTIGRSLQSLSAGCVVVGMSNIPTVNGNKTNWVPTDPIFIVGNGTDGSEPLGQETGAPAQSDAFVIYKSGRIIIPKRQGDILMGEFGVNPGD